MIAIYEPLYAPGQKLVDPAFRPLVIESGPRADWREFFILIDMYRRGMHRQQSFTGLMSPKFGLKTGISGSRFIDFVRANAGADVCFVNPFPYLRYVAFNVWMQGEVSHEGLVQRAQDLLDASGIELKLADTPRHGPATQCYCNFWVGNERFWDEYVGGFLMPIAEFLELNPDHPVSRSVLETTNHYATAPFLPFIVERLFSTFLSRPGSGLTSAGLALDPLASCLTEFDREIVSSLKSEVDDADRTGCFTDALKGKLALLSKLWQKYNGIYHEHHPHPHLQNPIVGR